MGKLTSDNTHSSAQQTKHHDGITFEIVSYTEKDGVLVFNTKMYLIG